MRRWVFHRLWGSLGLGWGQGERAGSGSLSPTQALTHPKPWAEDVWKEMQRPPRRWPTAGQTSPICALGLCRQHFQPWSQTFSASQADPRPNQGFWLLNRSQSETLSPCAEEVMREGQRLEAPPSLLSHDHRQILSLSFLICKMEALPPPGRFSGHGHQAVARYCTWYLVGT